MAVLDTPLNAPKKKLNSLPNIWTFSQYHEISKILVIGCGGTGGHLIPNLARSISVINSLNDYNKIELILADGDSVEKKNLIRQHFIEKDLGKNKAEVLSQRYSAAFGMEITAITKDIEDKEIIRDVTACRRRSCLVIGCVDNNASRKVIDNWFQEKEYFQDKFWIDSGNEETAGQVVCGFTLGSDRGKVICTIDKYGAFSLPTVLELYPNLVNSDKFNSQLSCAERAQSAPQNMLTNVTAATIIMNYVQKLLYRDKLTNHATEFSIDNVFSTKTNTPANLKKVKVHRRNYWEECIWQNC